MKNRFVFVILMVFVAHSAQAQMEFPSGCVLDHLDQICENIKKIKNTDKIVFADGTEMPACILVSADKAPEQKEIELAKGCSLSDSSSSRKGSQ